MTLHILIWFLPLFNNHHSQNRTVSGRAPEYNETLGATKACLALSTNPEPRQEAWAPEKREFFANWYIQRKHQSFAHKNNFSNLPKESLILAVLDNGGSPIGLPTMILFWFLFSWGRCHVLPRVRPQGNLRSFSWRTSPFRDHYFQGTWPNDHGKAVGLRLPLTILSNKKKIC